MKSQHWDEYSKDPKAIKESDAMPTGLDVGQKDYRILLRTGEEVDARVRTNMHYRAPGSIVWLVSDQKKQGKTKEITNEYVAAWKEK
jgi:hypothetical protein